MSKSIRISEENYNKLTKIGKGKIDDKFSTLLDQHEQVLIDQSKPSATAKTEPPTDYFLGLIIRYYYGLGKTIKDEMIYSNKKSFNYKNIDFLKQYITETGKIVPARVSNISSSEQRKLTKAIKIARFLALLPYTDSQQFLNEIAFTR